MTDVELAPTHADVHALPYVELLALLGESNLPPGGLRTVRSLAQECFLRPGIRALHVGSSGGYLSRELARLSGCNVLGIDISKSMVRLASARAHAEGLADLVSYEHRDARGFTPDGPLFDVALTGGSLAFVQGQEHAIMSMIDSVKTRGFVAISELTYRSDPGQALRDQIAEIIGVPIPHYEPDHWDRLFARPELQVCYRHEAPVRVPAEAEVSAYCARMVEWSASEWPSGARRALSARLEECFFAFAANLEHMNSVLLVASRLGDNDEPLLFT